jgi:fumarate hydratase, class I
MHAMFVCLCFVLNRYFIATLQDPEATENDKFVAMTLLKNANIASNFVLPGCQDTGTAVAIGKRGVHCLTDGQDEKHISRGVYDTYTEANLR